MTINHSSTVRNGIADLVDNEINTGGGTATLVFTTGAQGAGTAVATINLQNPAFDAAGPTGGNIDGVMTLEGTPLQDTNAVGGIVAGFKVVSRSSAVVFNGNVSTSNSDINLSSLSVGAGDTVEITSLTYTAPV